MPPTSDKFTFTNEDKLRFYALFKQINDGPCKMPAPSKLRVVEYYKHSAWKALGSITKEEAMKITITAVTLYVETRPNFDLTNHKSTEKKGFLDQYISIRKIVV